MLKGRLPKILFILIVAMVCFHASGVELVYCNDSNPEQSTPHGCLVCQPGSHAFVLQEAKILSSPLRSDLLRVDLAKSLHIQEPIFSIFHPPLAA